MILILCGVSGAGKTTIGHLLSTRLGWRFEATEGYDAEAVRQGLRARHIVSWLAKRNTERGSGLGRRRWAVERTFAWLNQICRLPVRHERRAEAC
jgi:cytidylate kinase